MKKKQRVLTLFMIIALSTALLLVSCGKKEKVEPAEPDNKGVQSENTVNIEKYEDIYAVYLGQVDNNSIELIVEPAFGFPQSGEPFTFRLADSVKKYFEAGSTEQKDFRENDIVRFDCILTGDGQWEITELENTTAEDKVYGPETGSYVGQIDSNSVEIEIEGQPRAFRLSPQIKLQLETNEPRTGQQVEIKYIKPSIGQEELIYLEAK